VERGVNSALNSGVGGGVVCGVVLFRRDRRLLPSVGPFDRYVRSPVLNLRSIGGEFGGGRVVVLREESFGEFVPLCNGEDGLYVC